MYHCKSSAVQSDDGVTRATRVAKSMPGTLLTVVVTCTLPVPVGGLTTVKERP
jgi:hypothetical protein